MTDHDCNGATLRDCGWCGLPMEVVHVYTRRTPVLLRDGVAIGGGGRVEYVSAQCVAGHWYGGPLADVTA